MTVGRRNCQFVGLLIAIGTAGSSWLMDVGLSAHPAHLFQVEIKTRDERQDEAPPNLMADGHCVVTLLDRGEWHRGERTFGANFDGKSYLFAGARERAIFAANPERYAPILGGDCIVTFYENGERVPGRVAHAARHAGRIYFFSSDDARVRFLVDPARYADVDFADDGRCAVTWLTKGRVVAGIPETVLTFGGLRYLFADDYRRRLFLENPQRYAAVNVGTLRSTKAAGPSALRNAVAAERDATSEPADADNQPFMPAMNGYCPVSIRQSGRWVRGRHDFRVEFGNLVFATAGPSEHDAIIADPVRFVPVLGGDCPVTFVDDGSRVPGSIYHAAEHQGRLYLFADRDRKEAFKAAPAKYALADVAADGLCTVTVYESNRREQGKHQHAAWHDGRVYYFVGSAERSKFLASPERYVDAANVPQPITDQPVSVAQ